MNLTQIDKIDLVNAIMADLPKLPSHEQIIAEVQSKIVDHMSPACQELYEHMPHALTTLCAHQLVSAYTTTQLVVGDVSEEKFFEITSPYEEVQYRRKDIEEQLEASLRNVRTAKALLTRFPQFAKYLPAVKRGKDPSTSPGIVDELIEMGWTPTDNQ